MAHIAGDIYIGKKVHFYLFDAVALAGFAPSAPHIKGKPARFVPSEIGGGGLGEKLSYICEKTRICGGIGARRSADGALVYVDDLIKRLDPQYFLMLARICLSAVKLCGKGAVNYGIDKRRFSAAGHSRHADKTAEGNSNVNIFQVILTGAHHGEKAAVAFSAHLGHLNFSSAGEKSAGDGIFILFDFLGSAGEHHLAAVYSRTGANIHDIVCRLHSLLVMLYHNDAVAQISQAFKGVYKSAVVSLVKSDAGLVQNIQHSREGGAYLGSKAYSLSFAAGKGTAAAGKGQIFKSHGHKKAKTRLQLLNYLAGDLQLRVRKLKRIYEFKRFCHRHGAKLIDVLSAYRNRKGGGGKPAAPAVGAGQLLQELVVVVLFRTALSHTGGNHSDHSVIFYSLAAHIAAEAAAYIVNFLTRAVKQSFHGGIGKGFKRLIHGKAVMSAHLGKQRSHPCIGSQSFEAVYGYSAFKQGQGTVGHNAIYGYALHNAQSRTAFAGAEGVVEGEHSGLQLSEAYSVLVAGVVGGKLVLRLLLSVSRDSGDNQFAAAFSQGGLHAVGKARAQLRLHYKPVHHYIYTVLLIFLKLKDLGKVVYNTVAPYSCKTAFLCGLKHLFVPSLFAAHNGRQHHKALPFGQGHYLVQYLIRGLLFYLLAAYGAVGHAETGVQKAQIIVYLRNGSHRGAGVFGGGLLVN